MEKTKMLQGSAKILKDKKKTMPGLSKAKITGIYHLK